MTDIHAAGDGTRWTLCGLLVRPRRGWASGTVAAGHVRVHRDGGAVTLAWAALAAPLAGAGR